MKAMQWDGMDYEGPEWNGPRHVVMPHATKRYHTSENAVLR